MKPVVVRDLEDERWKEREKAHGLAEENSGGGVGGGALGSVALSDSVDELLGDAEAGHIARGATGARRAQSNAVDHAVGLAGGSAR
jgi:hypothetical protein